MRPALIAIFGCGVYLEEATAHPCCLRQRVPSDRRRRYISAARVRRPPALKAQSSSSMTLIDPCLQRRAPVNGVPPQRGWSWSHTRVPDRPGAASSVDGRHDLSARTKQNHQFCSSTDGSAQHNGHAGSRMKHQ